MFHLHLKIRLCRSEFVAGKSDGKKNSIEFKGEEIYNFIVYTMACEYVESLF